MTALFPIRSLPALAALLPALAFFSPPAPAAERERVALVLSGGGALGFAHIGVLEVLEQMRVPVDCVVGASMGALVGGTWAAGVSPQTMRQRSFHNSLALSCLDGLSVNR